MGPAGAARGGDDGRRRAHGSEWVKGKLKDTGKEWLLGTGQSDTMKAILDRASEESKKQDLPGKDLGADCRL